MNMTKALLLGGVLGLTAACATPFTADVSRFQRLPAPTGQTFAIVPDQESLGGLEFATYSRYVAGELVEEGFTEIADPNTADMVVTLDYGVGDPREKVRTRPGSRFGFGYYGWNPYGYYGYPRPVFYDPWFYGAGMDRDVYSYTVYPAYLEMDIRQANGEPVFEGRAVSTTRNDDLTEVVPNLVTAMFTDFPGNNGRTIRVKVPQDDE